MNASPSSHAPVDAGEPELHAEFSTEGAYARYSPTRAWKRLRLTKTPEGFHCEKTVHRAGDESTVTYLAESLGEARAFFGGGWPTRELFTIVKLRFGPRRIRAIAAETGC